jgi:hypothetical protein
MRAMLVLALSLVTTQAWSFEGRYEGQATFVIGKRLCPIDGPALKFEVNKDGRVVGGVRTPSKVVPFDATVGPDGKLSGTYKTETDPVTIEAVLTDSHLEGFTQSPSCRYKLSFDRQ